MVDIHWADTTASKIIKEQGDKAKYVCASGITPSGHIHIGNFREVITTDFVVKALENKGKKVDFIYSWDDYDRLRKIPKGFPKELSEFIGMPIGAIPFKGTTYSEFFEKEFEDSIKDLGFNIKFIRQIAEYKKCKYAHDIKLALNEKDKIKKILDKYRREPLAKDWWPVFIYCEKCLKDDTKIISFDGEYSLEYECKCGHKAKIDFRKKGIVKLQWRVDWPARWAFYQEDFEPCGKDHSASGGSWTTSKEIVKKVWEIDGPTQLFYEWIGMKGGKQFASSTGNVITVNDMLEIYEPEIVRYLFASTRAIMEFAISFDLDVLKIYEDYDTCERIYYDKEELTNKKDILKQKRIYELSSVGKISEEMPEQIGFRHLTSLLQVHEGDIDKATEGFSERTKKRAKCAWSWLEKYAPEEMKFKVNESVPSNIKAKLNGKQKKALQILSKRLDKEHSSDELFNEFYNICKEVGIKNTEFFKGVYLVLISKEKGPRLSNFILILGKSRVRELLEQI